MLFRSLFERGRFAESEKADLRRDLLAYCERDTFVMVALLGRLHQLARLDA